TLLELTPILEGWSILVTAAGDGQEALETLADDAAFDLILMDLDMPSMDGFESTQHIRRDARLSDIAIIALTEKLDDNEQQRALACGVNGFMNKPVSADTLKTLLDQHFQNNTSQDPS
ncbi:hypothetical protein MNBD_GAMMA13-1010, partial [hydrothermal vent metagenome]